MKVILMMLMFVGMVVNLFIGAVSPNLHIFEIIACALGTVGCFSSFIMLSKRIWSVSQCGK